MLPCFTALLLVLGSAASAPSLRYLDPVVITGAEVPTLLGCEECVDRLVAFSWTDGAWSQAPLQVDERHVQDFYNIKGGECRLYNRNMKSLMYADQGTYSGLDEDDTLDKDDEIVFMARFVGEQSDGKTAPEGVLEGIMEELEVMDPVTDSSLGFMYLFLSDGSLDQSAGNPLIEYVFNLTTINDSGSNDYFDVYNFGASLDGVDHPSIQNKEDSYFQSPNYRRHFAENWNSDNLNIFSGDSTGEDLLAHQEFQFKKDNCGRCTSTFMHGGTGFIANKVGPVRAIRSWVGANSGTITQRETVMYEQREDLTTYLRVHGIPGVMDYITYTEDLPMVFHNCNNEEGITVDGVHEDDTFDSDFCPWEFVTGRAGSLLRTYQLDTDLGDYLGIPNELIPDMVMESWFYDNRVPEEIKIKSGLAIHPNNFHQCSTKLTSQKAAWGTHGVKLKSFVPGIPNTDPNRVNIHTPVTCHNPGLDDSVNKLGITNNYYYLPPGLDTETAKQIYQGATTPLTVRIKN